MEKTPEQVRIEKQVLEYTTLVIDPKDNIGLLGYQPTLTKIRLAWHNKELTFQDLGIVLTALAHKLGGGSESFKSVDEFRFAWPNLNFKKKEPKPELTYAQQTSLIQNVLGESKPKKRSAPRQPKKIEVDVSALPANLRKFVK